jgi:alpha-glucoside transport system permease protein
LVVTTDTEVAPPPPPEARPPEEHKSNFATHLLRIGVSLVVPVLAIVGLYYAGTVVLDEDANRVLVVVMAILIGVGGLFGHLLGMDRVVNRLPERHREAVRPFAFVGPAVVLLAIFLLYPTINTIVLSFQDTRGESFVGFENYVKVFTDSSLLVSLRNSLGWVIVVPLFSVVIGLAFPAMADRLGKRSESLSKTFIFMPMAISLVGASIVWRFVYSFRPEGFGEQSGILNGLFTSLGQEPIAWLLQEPWNNFYLMVILVWLQTGFAMVILSAAIKTVPEEIIEAARIDGANEWQVFRKVTIPSISSTIVVVATTVIITVWKVFDVVFVMTGGRFGTQVVAERMVTEFFTNRNSGIGATLAVVMLLAVIPLMVLNVKRFQEQEETR